MAKPRNPNKKAGTLPSFLKKHRYTYMLIAFAVVLVVGFTFVIWRHLNREHKPVDTSTWNNYSSSITKVSFLHPPGLVIRGEWEQMEGQDGTSAAPLESYADFTGYHLQYDNSVNSYSTAEDLSPSSNFQLDVMFYKNLTDFTGSNGQPGATSYRKNIPTIQSSTLQRSNGYTYKLLVTKQEQLLYTAATLLQCNDKGCSQVIRRNTDQEFPYMSVRITSTDGSRQGGATLSTSSNEYRVFESIVKSLRF